MKKSLLSKIIIVLTIVVILLNFYLMPPSQAGWLDDMLQSVIGLLTLPVRFVAVACGWAINALTGSLAYIEGTTDGSAANLFITPFDILFNKVAIFDINFFDIKTSGPEVESLVNKIRMGVAGWYYALRNISASALLVILIYVGIRMAITTIATDKAMYKKMLVDWIASMGILMLMHYIMIFAITVNNTIIKALSASVDANKLEQIYEIIKSLALDTYNVYGIAATVVYCMLVWQTLGLVFAYFNRILKLAFLTIISPLVTITYSLDKMGDGKAQALNNWFKEYIFTILIQPFHCVIYMSLIDIGLNLLTETNSTDDGVMLAAAVISILCIKFTKDAEGIVRKIFSFQDDGSTGLGAGLALAGAGMMYAKNIGKTARSSVNNIRNLGRTGSNALRYLSKSSVRGVQGMKNFAVGTYVAAKALKKGEGQENMSYSERRSEVRADMAEKKANKYEAKSNTTADAEAVEKEAAELYATNSKMTPREAKAQARANIAKRNRAAKKAIDKKEKKNNKHPNRKVGIVGPRTTLSRLRDIRDNSSVIKGLSDATKSTIAMGAGLSFGSGQIGIGSNISTAVMTSAAITKGVNEFMQGTRTTLRRGVKDNLQAMGVSNKKDASKAIGQILATHGDPEEAKSREAALQKELEKAFAEAGLDETYKTSLVNRIKRTAQANPMKTNQAIEHSLKGTGTADGGNAYTVNDGKIAEAAKNLADFYNGAEVFKSFQTAAEFGITADTFAADVMGGFRSNTTPSEIQGTVNENPSTSEQTPQDGVQPDNGSSGKKRKGKKGEIDPDSKMSQINKAVQEELALHRKQLEEMRDIDEFGQNAEVQQRMQEMEAEFLEYIEKAKQQMEAELKKVEEGVKAGYEKQINKIIRDMEKEIKAIDRYHEEISEYDY